MPRYDLGKLRRSSVLMTFGPGAIVDFRAEGAPVSAVVMGLEDWDRYNPKGLTHPQHIHEVRLEKKLKVQGFRLPPVRLDEDDKGDTDWDFLRANRFPDWLQCPSCNRIGHSALWSNDPGKAGRYCQFCSHGEERVHVVPVRFVLSCDKGHLDDFPWHFYVNHKKACTNKSFLVLKSERPGLAGLMLSCPDSKCNAKRSLDGIFSKDAIPLPCRGHRPWLGMGANEPCDQSVRVLQRGASNMFFPVLDSALSIPPWSDRLQDALGIYWHSLVAVEDESQRRMHVDFLAKGPLVAVLEELNMSSEELSAEVGKRIAKHGNAAMLDIRGEEFRELCEKVRSSLPDPEFEVRHEPVPGGLKNCLDRLARVVRVREVRAMRGFARIEPPGDDPDRIARISRGAMDWLPGIEVRGEGIFLTLREDLVSRWESSPAVVTRTSELAKTEKKDRLASLPAAENVDPGAPRFLLLHTLAHALMRQLSLECGYSTSSLRERLYVREGDFPMAGFLIYTATPDSDGTLGGLQRQGDGTRMQRIFRSAIEAMRWCSSDPLCIEGAATMSDSRNLAACHSCVLAPETACEMFNQYLDRAMLVGTPANPSIGFFQELLGD